MDNSAWWKQSKRSVHVSIDFIPDIFLYRYVTSAYYVTATASTVGYGDFYAKNSREKVFMLVLEFIGICSFSLITGNMMNLKQRKRIDLIIA